MEEGGGRQLSRTDLSRAAAVIAASLPAAQQSANDPDFSPSLEERAASHAQASGSGAGQQQDEGGRQHAKRGSAVAVHGNYHRYYGYRLGQAVDRDPRIEVRYFRSALELQLCSALHAWWASPWKA